MFVQGLGLTIFMSQQRIKNEINLRVLKKYIPDIKFILRTSSHVAVYDFKQHSWFKTGIEGTMFLFQRAVFPYYGFFVINRLSTQNLLVMLHPSMETKLLGDYLVYKHMDQIQGLWIFEENDRLLWTNSLIEYSYPIKQLSLPEIARIINEMGPTHEPVNEEEFTARFRMLLQVS